MKTIAGTILLLALLPPTSTPQERIAEPSAQPLPKEDRIGSAIYEAFLRNSDVPIKVQTSMAANGIVKWIDTGGSRMPPDCPMGAWRPKTAPVRSYSTRFQLNEDPISEGGKWINGARDGIDWHNVITRNGAAYGAVSKGAYTDPTALLAGEWGRDQFVKAKVFSRNPTDKYFQEVEIRLRSTLARHRCTGYEVFWRCLKTNSAYAEIVRWNEKVGDWTSLKKHSGPQYGVKDGDWVEATIVGNVIKGYVNGVEVISAADGTYSTGSPGMGFNYGVEESNADLRYDTFS